jgi:hypothetical protein
MFYAIKIESLKTIFVASLLTCIAFVGTAIAEDLAVPDRLMPRPETTSGVPHVQIGVSVVPEV